MKQWTCADLDPRWPEYLYREMEEHDLGLAQQHLRQCPHCRSQEMEWRQLLGEFDRLASLDEICEAPPHLVFRVNRQVRIYQDWMQETTARIRNWALGTTAALAIISFSSWALMQRSEPAADHNRWMETLSAPVLGSWFSPQRLNLYQELDVYPRVNEATDAGAEGETGGAARKSE